MKLNRLTLLFAGVGILASSCNLDTDDKDNYQSRQYPVINLISSLSGEDSYAQRDTYVFTYYYMAGKLVANSSGLTIGTNKTPFSTNEIPYTSLLYNNDASIYEVTTFKGGTASASGLPITNIQGFSTVPAYVVPADPDNPNSTSLPGFPYQARAALVMSYNVGTEYTVRTFLDDAAYKGVTTVNIVGAPMPPFTGKDTYYRVVFDNDLKKASIIFYYAKFAETMPGITFLVRDLDVVYGKNGYTISMPEGTDYIIPEMMDGTELLPYKPYRFTLCNFVPTSSDLTQASIFFNVERLQYSEETGEPSVTGQFTCSFDGAYTYTAPKE